MKGPASQSLYYTCLYVFYILDVVINDLHVKKRIPFIYQAGGSTLKSTIVLFLRVVKGVGKSSEPMCICVVL